METRIRKILKALYLDYPGTALYKEMITVKTGDRILAQGTAEEIYSYPCFNEDWSILSIQPDQSVRNRAEYKYTPDYNLPKIIEVI